MMKNKKSLSATDGGDDDINISPLIDMVFILLIFFIVTTVFVEEPGVEIVKPTAYNADDLPKNVVLIGVTDNNDVFYGGDPVGLGGIRTHVRRVIKENKDMPVIIQADRNAHTGIIARLIDEVKLAEVPPANIHLSTERSGR